ncbi:MAG: TonB-dependent receptor [Alphaproteobacteria bacterium]|nr:TonB-dependent receptor [Alphaproteobacteria bacterium]
MRMTRLSCMASTALCLAFLAAGSARAQAPVATEGRNADEAASAQPDANATAAAGDEAIVVTGTRIRSPNLTSAVPITSLEASELTDTGNVSLGDELNKLPAMHATFSQANSTGFIGTSGLNLLDLRGLGTARTLVLVNGRRHITAQPGTPSSIDVNTIPVDLVDRIDIVTGGNSAIYGSDAVAGVVNFVLKRNFDGVRVRAQGGISSHGDRGSYFASVTAGHNFAEGRGNVAVAAEYSFADDLYYTDRDGLYGAYSGRLQFNAVENTLGETPAGDGIPDQAFLTNIRNGNISEGGTYAATCPAAVASTAPNFAAVQARRALNCTGERSNTGAELGNNFMFDRQGNLLPNACVRDLRPFGSGNCVGGQGSSLRLTGQLLPQLERKAVNLLAHFEVSPAFSPFIEAKFVRSDGNQEGQPTSIANLQGTYSINNPFLTSQARDVLVRSLAPGATTFSIQRFNVDFGGRGENLRRDTYRIAGGVEGDFNDDWHYELSANYGHLKTHLDALNRILIQNFRNSADAVRNAQGQIVCGINADATTANDDPACVPINVFGDGQPSAAALDYVSANVFRDQSASQFDALGYLSGDLSQLFELPGGPIGFALGAEYRRETASSVFDPVTTSGATDANVIPPFHPPALLVKEAFGELRVPLLRDVRFARELSFEAAGRVSAYNKGAGTTGTVWTYNFGGIYAPSRDIRFRAGYARSVRAPTQSNLYAVPTQTFLNGLIDPCSQTNIRNGTANRVANCAAAGVPTSEVVNGLSVPWTNVPSSGIRGLNGSNPNLFAEQGKSLTVGAVLQPRFLPGFSLTVDYYDITVKNVINTLAPQTIIDLCYDSSTGINNPYCAAVFRRPDGTFKGQSNRSVGGSTVQYDVGTNDNSFLAGPFNYAKLKTSGIDFDAAYRHKFGGVGIDLRGILSWIAKRDSYTNVNDPTFRDRTKSELGDPEFAGSFSAKADFGMFDLSYNLRWIGKQTIDFYETTHTLDGRPPTDLDKFPVVWTPNVFYHAIRLGLEPKGGFRFYVGVDNVFNRAPPYGFDGTCATGGVFACGAGGVGTAIYENVGRFFYGGAELKF